jgi:hypothetical protein
MIRGLAAIFCIIINVSCLFSLYNSTVTRGKTIVELQAELAIEQEKVARDDIILNKMLELPWDRNLPVHHRWYFISTGDTVHAFTQYPNPDKYYQLSY